MQRKHEGAFGAGGRGAAPSRAMPGGEGRRVMGGCSGWSGGCEAAWTVRDQRAMPMRVLRLTVRIGMPERVSGRSKARSATKIRASTRPVAA